ncbi:hypothetical protein AMJ40_04675 [candidate division TA06 bacterium DG_26]|uniref:Dockerin domain-containing protein n=1 Tax=candidate division TA06 bacterium DG_26 TaxID=1703771 RepID=A0A0S7WI50_UNCT6|nr:MAG: hypothetical protein AMJ40_04675 [candidate division TA06 bacterium DG_26]
MDKRFVVAFSLVFISSFCYAFTDSLWVVAGGGFPGDPITVEVWLQYEGGGAGDSISSFDIPLTWDATICTLEALTIGSDFSAWINMSRIDNQGTQGPPPVAKASVSAFTFGPPIGPPQVPRGTHLAATLDFRILSTAVPPASACIDTLIEAFTPPVYLGFSDKNGIEVYMPSFSSDCILVLEHLTLFDGTPRTVGEGTTLSFVVRAIDVEPTHLITLEATYLPSGATFPPASGYDSVRSTFTWTPGYCDAGLDSAIFHAYCPTAEKYATSLITVENTNRAPTMHGGPNRSIEPGNTLSFTVKGRDADYYECADDVLTLGALDLPGTATFVQNSDTTGLFEWTPQEADTGVYTVIFTVTDLAAASDSDDVRVNVAYTLDSLIAVVRSYACPGLPEFGVPIVSVNFRPLERYTFIFEYDPEFFECVRVDTAGTASGGAELFRADWYSDLVPPETVKVTCWMDEGNPIPAGKNTLAYAVFAVDSSVVPPDTGIVHFTEGSDWTIFVDARVPIEAICCGDVNGNGKIGVSDAIYLTSYLYRIGPPPVADGDVNLDGKISVADANYLITYIYRGGTPPCQPPFFDPALERGSVLKEE